MLKDVKYTEYRKTLTLKRARRLLYDVTDHIFFYHSDTNKPTTLLFTITTTEISIILRIFKYQKAIKSHVSVKQEVSGDNEDYIQKASNLGYSWTDPIYYGNLSHSTGN